MKILFTIFGILITIFIVFFAQFNELTLALAIPYTKIAFEASFFVIATGIFALGILVGAMFLIAGILESTKKAADTKKRLERVSVGADDSELKVKTLENKIQTLELALKKALNKDEQA